MGTQQDKFIAPPPSPESTGSQRSAETTKRARQGRERESTDTLDKSKRGQDLDFLNHVLRQGQKRDKATQTLCVMAVNYNCISNKLNKIIHTFVLL